MYNVTDRFTFPFCPKDKLIFSTLPRNEMRVWVLVFASVCLSLCMCLPPVPQRIGFNWIFRLKMEIVQKLHNVLFTRLHMNTDGGGECVCARLMMMMCSYFIWMWIIFSSVKVIFISKFVCSVSSRGFFLSRSLLNRRVKHLNRNCQTFRFYFALHERKNRNLREEK